MSRNACGEAGLDPMLSRGNASRRRLACQAAANGEIMTMLVSVQFHSRLCESHMKMH
jgi:hypothetical protein